MDKYDNAQMSLEAVDLGIKSLVEYSEQISEFSKETLAVLQELGATHRDQNYSKFCDFFEPIWNKMNFFKNEVDAFRSYLEEEKKLLEEYIETGNKPILKR